MRSPGSRTKFLDEGDWGNDVTEPVILKEGMGVPVSSYLCAVFWKGGETRCRKVSMSHITFDDIEE